MTILVNVTNTFTTLCKTGIQRVVREVVSRLVQKQNIVLIAWSESSFYQISSKQEISKFLEATSFTPQKEIKINQLKKGDIFFDFDASWGDQYDIMQLYQLLKQQGVILVKMHYDAVPVLFPQFSHPNIVFSYTDNIAAALQYCDYWLCISQTVRTDLLKIAYSIDAGEPVTKVIPLGADFSHNRNKENSKLGTVKYGTYILLVGTLEPRKNHALILDVFDQLLLEDPVITLVIVGKRGWNIDIIVNRIEKQPHYNNRIFWIQNATDAELSLLYKNALVTANFSHYEGYGLPVIESLSHDCVTICASGGAMEEVALGSAYCVAADIDSVVDAFTQLKLDSIYSEYKQKAEQFIVPKWADSAAEISNFLQDIQQAKDILYTPRQAVYISIQADALHRSLISVIKNMTFITKVVILCSDKVFDTISQKLEDIPLDISILKESELGIVELSDDQQIRNTYLRRILYTHDKIESNFIAFDDDSIAIAKVNSHDFIDKGKHKAYYYYDDGCDWLGAFPVSTSFDQGIWRTAKYLNGCGYDTKLYNSHMPQIINKKICNSILNRTSCLDLDEWSSYFNIAKHLYPQFFKDHIYRTIGWPPNFDFWLPVESPKKVIFENFYETNVDQNASREGLDKILDFSQKYKEAYTLRKSISPALPEIIISKGGLILNADFIECKKNIKLFIKLTIDANNFILKCKYSNHEQVYNDNSIPRFLYIQSTIFKDAQNGEINISLIFPDSEKDLNLLIPVHFL